MVESKATHSLKDLVVQAHSQSSGSKSPTDFHNSNRESFTGNIRVPTSSPPKGNSIPSRNSSGTLKTSMKPAYAARGYIASGTAAGAANNSPAPVMEDLQIHPGRSLPCRCSQPMDKCIPVNGKMATGTDIQEDNGVGTRQDLAGAEASPQNKMYNMKRKSPQTTKTVSDMMDKLSLSDRNTSPSVTHNVQDVPNEPNQNIPRKKVKRKKDKHRGSVSSEADAFLQRWKQLSEDKVTCLFDQDLDGDNLLMVAILSEHIALALSLIWIVPDASFLNCKNDLFQTALHFAVLTQNRTLLRELVTRGADITAQDRNGNTPLHIACFRNDLTSVIALTMVITPSEQERCPYPVKQIIPQPNNIFNYKGQTCLHVATEAGHFNIVRFLIETDFHADINTPERLRGRTALHIAVENGSKSLVRYFLSRSELNLHQVTYSGHSGLDLAIGLGKVKVIQLLVKAGSSKAHEGTDSSSEEAEEDWKMEDFIVNNMEDSAMMASMESMDTSEYDDFCVGGRSVSDSLRMSGSIS